MGEEERLLELKAVLNKVYKLKGKVLGPDEGDSKDGVYLGRRLQWCDWHRDGGQSKAHPGAAQSHSDGVLQICEHADDSGELQRQRLHEDRLPTQTVT